VPPAREPGSPSEWCSLLQHSYYAIAAGAKTHLANIPKEIPITRKSRREDSHTWGSFITRTCNTRKGSHICCALLRTNRKAQLLTALANAQLQNGETELALANARKVPSLANPKTFAISHLIVAQALAGKGKDDEIAKEYKEFLKEAPDSPLAPRVKDALAKLNSK